MAQRWILQNYLLVNSVHEVSATQPDPFVLHPERKGLHSETVKPFL